MSVASLLTGIETQIQAALPTYKALTHVVDVSKNSFGSTKTRYGVLPLNVTEVSGATNAYTVDQDFEIVLTDSFITTSQGDTGAREKALSLIDKAHTVYKKLIQTKCGDPSNCLLVSSLRISDPIYDESKIVVIQFNISVRYRIPT